MYRFSFVLLVCCFDMHIYITHSKQGRHYIDSNSEGPTKKVGGPEYLVRGPGNFIVPPPINFYFIPCWLHKQKYLSQLEDQKKQKTQQASRKRKLVSDEVEQLKIRGQSNLTKSAHSPVRGHPRGSKFVPLNSWGRVSY